MLGRCAIWIITGPDRGQVCGDDPVRRFPVVVTRQPVSHAPAHLCGIRQRGICLPEHKLGIAVVAEGTPTGSHDSGEEQMMYRTGYGGAR